MAGKHFQPLQYALVVRDDRGDKINSTGSSYDLAGTRRFARSILRLMPQALFIDIHPYQDGLCSKDAVETVPREDSDGHA